MNEPKKHRASLPRLGVRPGPSTHALPGRAGSASEIRHVWTAEMIDAVDSALAIGRILLIEGEPGVGKSQIAKAAAEELGWLFRPKAIDAWTETRDLGYEFDQVRRLGDAQAGREEAAKNDPYLTPGVLWWAFDAASALALMRGRDADLPADRDGRSGVVVLLDEIDKAEREVPNGLLRALDELEIETPRGIVRWGDPANGQPAPLVVATTNDERELPDAFVRRSLVLRLALPTNEAPFKERLRDRARARYGAGDGDPFLDVVEAVLDDLWVDRRRLASETWPGPGQAEFFDMLEILRSRFDGKDEQLAALARVREFVFRKRKEPETR